MKECPICLKEMNPNELCITDCNHEFCNTCLNKWFDRNRNDCPKCRKIIKNFKQNDIITKIINVNSNIELTNRLNDVSETMESLNINNISDRIDSIIKINKKLKYLLIFSGFINISLISTSIFFYVDDIINF